jgi:hypothetical protein
MKKLLSKEATILYAGLIVGFFITMGIVWFFSKYELQSPIRPFWKEKTITPVTNTPVIIHPTLIPIIVPSATPTPTIKPRSTNLRKAEKETIIANSKYPDFIDHIWERESGRGTDTTGLAGYCISKGMTNEFGFYPTGKWCWKTFEEAVARVELWREKEAKGLTDKQALCYYNGAGKVNTCAYLTYNFEAMN